MSTIECRSVTKVYRKDFWRPLFTAVDHLTFSVKEHAVTGFVGPNGAGKTTTIKMIMGLAFPTSGEVLVGGKRSVDVSSRKAIGFLTEQPYLYRHLSVVETMRFSGRLRGLNGRELERLIESALADVGLTGRETTRVTALSKGLAQRLNMACSLLGDPPLMVFDEPMSGMDPPGRRLFRELFRKLTTKGVTVFFSTHVLEDIEAVCDDVVVITDGRLRYDGKVGALLDKGFLGTDIEARLPAPEQEHELKLMGLLTERVGDSMRIHVPAGQDAAKCQQLLYERGIYCLSIRRRNKPLEELLFGNPAPQTAARAKGVE